MCGRYAVVTKVKVIEERFGVKVKKPKEPKAEVAFEPHANIGVGMFAPVITQAEPHELQAMQFGLTPSWAKKPMYLFNARMEGDHNKEDSPDYRGAKGIIEKPSFRKAIRSQRCLVVADAFLEGSKEKGLSEPFLVYMRKKERPFAFAGIYESWYNQLTGDTIHGFAIVTSPANSVLQRIGHHRCPVILSKSEERLWLESSASLSQITELLHTPSAADMNAYPVSAELKNARNQRLDLLLPLGERVMPEWGIEIESDIEMFGMGESRSGRKRDNENGQLELF
jgi:putative SOS response-associated peptidase YedK